MSTTNSPEAQPQGVELKLCPFCGGKALIEEFGDSDDPQPLFVATCEACPVKSYDQFSAQEAARVWNTRADLPRATADDCAYCDSSLGCAEHGDDNELQQLRREFELSGLGDRPSSMSAAKLRRLIRLEQIVHVESTPRATGETEALVDEVQRRMDQVVECAVEWHQSDDNEWLEKADALGVALDSLLEMRAAIRTEGEGEK